jgi:hypothetical protein
MTQKGVWKPIGEASAGMDAQGLYIERIDGYRVPVSRHQLGQFPLPRLEQEASRIYPMGTFPMNSFPMNPFNNYNW